MQEKTRNFGTLCWPVEAIWYASVRIQNQCVPVLLASRGQVVRMYAFYPQLEIIFYKYHIYTRLAKMRTIRTKLLICTTFTANLSTENVGTDRPKNAYQMRTNAYQFLSSRLSKP